MLDRTASNAILSLLKKRVGSRFYSDGQPTWTEGKQKKPAQTSKEARNERRKLIKVLRRHGKDNDRAVRLADLLSSCCKKHRCLSGACPVCSRAAQRLLVLFGNSVVERGGKHWQVASVVWREHRYAEGRLNADLMFERLKERLQEALAKASIRLAFGGFDISMNEHKHGRFSPHWRPHAWILVATKDPKKLRKHLKEAFPPSKRVRRPVRVVRYDHSLAGLAYAFKTNFVRRVSLPRMKKADSTLARRNTRNRDLRATQKVELALALHKTGLASRVFGLGIEAVNWDDCVDDGSTLAYRPRATSQVKSESN